MTDLIQLLPDNIANQIAAGEVIQRPASAVKELLENAVDAGATEIKLIVADSGKSLIQVVDNGRGMSLTDARLCFERHATSKIRNIEDLFRIRTMGFRGEALASIAAVAQVEMKTKRADDEAGTLVEIENSVVLRQEPVAMINGTSIAMKNLFFNIPARRNFLKSNPAEMRHIVDEFMRVAMAFPDIHFSLSSNGQQLFFLEPGSLKQRIVQLLGNQYAAKLVGVQEKTDYLNIRGFVGKPDTARKTRGDQFFFVNSRFIRSAYLNHAVMNAFQDMIPADSFPMYVLFIDLDPAQVDINVHPTKQEIKFEDEKIVYAFVQSAVKHALAQYSITPALDFDLDPQIQQLDAVTKPFTTENEEAATGSQLFRNFSLKNQAHFIQPAKNNLSAPPPAGGAGLSARPFESLLDQIRNGEMTPQPLLSDHPVEDTRPVQLHFTYILAETHEGFMLVHQQLAHERILYEKYSRAAGGSPVHSQRSLFPATLELPAPDAVLLTELLPDLQKLGYQVEPFGHYAFVIQGIPADLEPGREKLNLEQVLETIKKAGSELKLSQREKLLRAMARQHAIKTGKALSEMEMISLLADLFRCEIPNATANGQPTYTEFRKSSIDQLFKR